MPQDNVRRASGLRASSRRASEALAWVNRLSSHTAAVPDTPGGRSNFFYYYYYYYHYYCYYYYYHYHYHYYYYYYFYYY